MVSPGESIIELGEELLGSGTCGLAEIALPNGFARREGDWNGRKLELQTRLFGNEAGDVLRIAIIASESMATLTVLGIAGDAVLGVDVVTFEGSFATLIADFSSTSGRDDPERVARLRETTSPLRRRAAVVPPVPADAPFGPALVWLKPNNDDGDEVVRVVRAYVEELRLLLPTTRRAAPTEGLSRYLRWLATSKKQMKVLARLFGGEWVERYFDEVFLKPPTPLVAR